MARDVAYILRGDSLRLAADPVLGGHYEPTYGIAAMPAGFDGRIREWARFVAIDGVPRPTLIWSAIREYCSTPGRPGCPHATELNSVRDAPFTFSRDVDFQTLNLSEFLTDDSAQSKAESCSATLPDPRFENRIVLLGGFYSREDLHDTPWGKRTGVELLAMAIEQELQPQPLHHLALPFKWGIKALIAFGIAFMYHRLRPVPAVLSTLCVLPALILISGYLAFYLGDSDLAVVPFLVGILIEQLVTGTEQAEYLAHRATRRSLATSAQAARRSSRSRIGWIQR